MELCQVGTGCLSGSLHKRSKGIKWYSEGRLTTMRENEKEMGQEDQASS